MTYYKLPASLSDDIREYEELVGKYQNGDIDKSRIKAFRVPMGVYEQRDEERYMMRVRLPGGAISPEQLIRLSEISAKYTTKDLHLTTRQDIQIHDLKLKDTVALMNDLKPLQLSSRGGGGNTVRNILGSYDSGLDEEEIFDTSPYVRELTNRLIAENDSWTLPRKFKIGFSGSAKDTGLATVNDVGFIAKKLQDGTKGFSVYAAGGMGKKSRTGILLYDFIPEDRVYITVRAIKNLFDKFGNRKNKHNARLRFLFQDLGEQEFRTRLDREIELLEQSGHLPLEITETPPLKHDGSFELPLFLGDISLENSLILGNILKKYGEDVLRVIPAQNLLIRNIDQSDISALKNELKEIGILTDLPDLMGNAAACAGSSTCKLGFCLSRNLLTALSRNIDREIQGHPLLQDIRIKISGCPNTCGQHIIADLGFYGTPRRQHDRLLPAYTLVAGGRIREGQSRLAEKIGDIPAKAIPSFLTDFFIFTQENRKQDEEFTNFLERTGKEYLKDLQIKYKDAPTIQEAPEYYFDWYDSDLFSLLEKMEGECSAGLFDLIDYDLAQASKAIALAEKSGENQELLKATYHSANALLVTRGHDPKTHGETFRFFRQDFIGKYIPENFESLIAQAEENGRLDIREVSKLHEVVKKLYEEMDNSLRFPEKEKEEVPQSENTEEELLHDFRGVKCPMNFVKTKLVLETLKSGDRLRIYLDDGEPIKNVPGSVRQEGHTILEKEKKDGYWTVLIRKC